MQSGTHSPGRGQPVMRRGAWARLALVLAVASAPACHRGLVEPEHDPPVLRFQPTDQRSDVGNEVLQLRLFDLQRPIDSQLVSRLAAGTEVLRWPEMTSVAVERDVSCCDPPGYGANGGPTPALGTVLLRPLMPLEVPHHAWSGNMADTAPLEKWILSLREPRDR